MRGRKMGWSLALVLGLSGCGSQQALQPDWVLDRFPVMAASFPLQTMAQQLQQTLTQNSDSSNSVAGSTAAAWRLLNPLVSREPVLVLAYPPSDQTEEDLAYFNTEWEASQIAWDGLVLLSGAQNPVDSLSLQQLRQIYSGQIRNWSEVGGADEPIRFYVQDQDSGLQTAFESQVMDGLAIEGEQQDWVFERAGVVRQQPASFSPSSDALGFSSLSRCLTHPDPAVKMIAIEGVRPSIQTLSEGRYPLRLAVLAAARLPVDEPIAQTIAWLRTEQGQQWLRSQSLAPLSEQQLSQPPIQGNTRKRIEEEHS